MVCSETNPEFLSHHLKCEVTAVRTEEELLTKFVDIVRFHDPDILVGYEVL